jgi:hypothetical protein
MLILAVLVVMSGPFLSWAMQAMPSIPDGGKLAVEWISPAILCSILLKLLWDERADVKVERTAAKDEREKHEKLRDEHERELRALLRETTGALDRVAARYEANTAILADVRDVIVYCKRHGDGD